MVNQHGYVHRKFHFSFKRAIEKKDISFDNIVAFQRSGRSDVVNMSH